MMEVFDIPETAVIEVKVPGESRGYVITAIPC